MTPSSRVREVSTWTLTGADGRPYPSAVPGAFGGHRRSRIYGRLDCRSARQAIARGGYVPQRVFFLDEAAARAAGYRPCAVCLPDDYAAWKAADSGVVVGQDGLARPAWAAVDPLLREYYDTEWGVPVRDERGLYERICLEGFQSGLSWATILRKRPAFRAAFVGFDPDRVAAFTGEDVERLMADAGIVRNRRKIEATITNAAATVALRSDGGLVELVWAHRPQRTPRPRSFAEIDTVSTESTALAKALRARGFAFVGPTTMHALMEAIGILDTHLLDSHRRGSSGVWPE